MTKEEARAAAPGLSEDELDRRDLELYGPDDEMPSDYGYASEGICIRAALLDFHRPAGVKTIAKFYGPKAEDHLRKFEDGPLPEGYRD